MRIAINRIKKWWRKTRKFKGYFVFTGLYMMRLISVLQMNMLPFILPRLRELMKLRKFIKRWIGMFPIECDAEYGIAGCRL